MPKNERPERQVRKGSRCGGKQQRRLQAVIILILLVRATYTRVLHWAHILHVERSACHTAPPKWLQQHALHSETNRSGHVFFFGSTWHWHPGHSAILLRSQSSTDMCAKLHTVAASNNRDHPMRPLYNSLFASQCICANLNALPFRVESRMRRCVGRATSAVHSFLSPFLCMGMTTPVYQPFGTFQNTRPLDTHESTKGLAIQGFGHFRSDFIATCSIPSLSVVTARKTLVAMMIFSYPKCASCVSDGVIVIGFKRPLKYSLHLPRMFSSLLSMTLYWSSINLAVWDLSPPDILPETPVILPEHFVGLSVIGIQFMREMLPRFHYALFYREGCERSGLSVPRIERRCSFVLNACLAGYFLCMNTIFHHAEPFLATFPISWWNYSCFAQSPLHLRCAFWELAEQRAMRFVQSSFLPLCPLGPPTLFDRTYWICTLV